MARRGDSLDTIWPRPAHTKAKHDILVQYLQAWFAIMGGSSLVKRAGVLDGFAGPGVYADGEPGSPLLVLNTLLDHDAFSRWDGTEFVFLFNEQDEARFRSLEATVADIAATSPKNVSVQAVNRSFSDLAEAVLNDAEKTSLIPLFAFVDPFGYRDCSMDLIRRLLQYDKAELFIYFDFNSANRFAGKGVGVDERFKELFGTDEFVNAPVSGPERGRFLHDLYLRQLKQVCSFAHVQSFAMINESGHIGNYMFFCTRNLQAFDKMKAVMWKLDPSGAYRFEDRFAEQDVLFDDQAGTEALQADLAAHFAGQEVLVQTVIDYVIAETPYHSGQVKTRTLKPMQAAGRISSPNQRRRGQFPDGTRIWFP